MGSLTEKTPDKEHQIDVRGLQTITVKEVTKEVIVPKFVEKEVEVPIFKKVEVISPKLVEKEMTVPKIVYSEVDITEIIGKIVKAEMDAALKTILSKMKLEVKITPTESGVSVRMGE